MTAISPAVKSPAESSPAIPEFTCAEVWGGNRPADRRIDLPGMFGRLYSKPCDGGRGGDVHYVSICGSGLVARLCVADVAGHGESVARVSDETHQLLRKSMNDTDQRRVLARLNSRLYGDGVGVMTTLAAATYVAPMRMLSISYAGHPPAWLYRQETGRWEKLFLPSANDRRKIALDIPLAIDDGTQFTRRKERVRMGDRLLLLTDGVLEALSPTQELFGEERLEALLAAHAGDDVDTLVDEVLAQLVRHTQDEDLAHDDVTLMVLQFRRGPRALGIWDMIKNRTLGRRRRIG